MFSTVIQSVRFMAQLGVSLTIAIGILLNTLSFLSAKTSASAMSCCDAAGHCNSALMAKQAMAEPMCGGQKASSDLDEITVYAKPDQTSDTSENPSVTSPCATDCSSLQWAASVNSKKGFAALIQRGPVAHRPKQVLKSEFEFRNVFVSTPSSQSVPRGPPTV